MAAATGASAAPTSPTGAAVEAAFADDGAVRPGDPPRRPGRGALQPREPGGLRREQPRRASPTCSRPAGAARTPHLVFASTSSVYGANTRDAVLRGPGGRPPAAVLRRHQAGERADGARLRASLRPALHRLALLHRLRPLGPARHGADDLRRRDQRGPADPALQRRPAQPRLHLRRRHRRGGGPRRRRRRDARPGLGPGGPRPRHLVGAVPDLQHRQRRPGRSSSTSSPRSSGRSAARRSARPCRRSPATCPTPGPTAPGSRPPPAGAPRPRSTTASPASSPGTATTTGR